MDIAQVKQNSVDPVFVKEHLVNQINDLKKDIQDLLDQRKKLSDKNEISKCMDVKQKKIETLKILNDKLRDICKRERGEAQKRNELRSITRAVDSINFGAAKKKNTAEAMDKAKQAKVQREDTRLQYLEYQRMEQEYLEHDIETLPGCLFLNKNVLKEYGLCPYIDIFTEETIGDKETLKTKRIEWLESKDNNGKLYYDLYKELFQKDSLKKFIDEKVCLETEIDNYIINLLTDSQIDMYKDCQNFIKEYMSCHIKTKRIKERFKVMINTLSILYSETGIEMHSYFSYRYGLTIVINILDCKKQLSISDKLQRSISIERFQDYLERYKNALQNVDRMEKYTINTLNNLKMDLYYYLTDKQNFLTKHDILEVKRLGIKQEGKYFKRWSLLTDEERIERFYSYTVFYVDKNLIEPKLIDKTLREDQVKKLNDLLSESFIQKRLLYKHINWNIKRGIIENVKILRYNNDNIFCLDIPEPLKSVGQDDNENVTQDESSTTRTAKNEKDSGKKKISVRTIITKDIEKIINEELLYFILKRVQNGVVEPVKEDKDAFGERIKTKLKIKKIMVTDKTKIYEKYDEIFNVVKNNV
jgi:hypothetical protein